jgi:transposase
MPFVRAYPRESQEMVFDAHARAFEFYRGACTRGIYDNMKTAVESVFVGKDRQFNRRFLQMCGQYLVEPTACTPASGMARVLLAGQIAESDKPDARRKAFGRASSELLAAGRIGKWNDRIWIVP